MEAGDVVGYSHVGITVSDMDQALGFYRDGLGLELVSDGGYDAPYLHAILGVPFASIRIARLQVPGIGHIELLDYLGTAKEKRSADPSRPASGHLALNVTDLDAALARLAAAGFTPVSDAGVLVDRGVNVGSLVAYIADPDGYFIELIQRPRADGEPNHASRTPH